MEGQSKTRANNPLDMSNYDINKLPKREVSGFESVLRKSGGVLAVLAFVYIYFFLIFRF